MGMNNLKLMVNNKQICRKIRKFYQVIVILLQQSSKTSQYKRRMNTKDNSDNWSLEI